MRPMMPATHAEPPGLAHADGAALRLRALTRRYGDRLAVNALSLAVPRGSVYGFLGPNGAGKTTTIRMALGLIAPSAGAVEIFGLDLASEGRRVLPRVGALIEQPAFYPYMSGRDNLRTFADALGGVSEARLDAVLELVGLRGRDGDRARTYSLGMKQRLGIGIALLHDPALLVLDEPTNGLDPAGIVEMRDLLRRLAAEGKTIFISSHVLGEVRQTCDRVAIINHGKLIRESTVDELVRGQGELLVSVDRPAEALAMIQAQPWGRLARMATDGQIITPAPDQQSASLNLFLVRAGFAPGGITERTESLEEIFLRLTQQPSA